MRFTNFLQFPVLFLPVRNNSSPPTIFFGRVFDQGISENLCLPNFLFSAGPAKAKELFDEGIIDLDALQKNKDKLSHGQKIGLKHFADFELRIPRAEVTQIFERLMDLAQKLDNGYLMEVCGSYRRGAVNSGDIDVLLTHKLFKHADKMHGNLLHRDIFDRGLNFLRFGQALR